MNVHRRLFGDVAPGERLPALVRRLTDTDVALGAAAARDWRPMHHDHTHAVERAGARAIFMSTPNQAAWLERYVTDWTGPTGRLGRMSYRMSGLLCSGDEMTVNGVVEDVERDEQGCGWARVRITVTVDEAAVTTCTVRVALPVDETDNPWARKGAAWCP